MNDRLSYEEKKELPDKRAQLFGVDVESQSVLSYADK